MIKKSFIRKYARAIKIAGIKKFAEETGKNWYKNDIRSKAMQSPFTRGDNRQTNNYQYIEPEKFIPWLKLPLEDDNYYKEIFGTILNALPADTGIYKNTNRNLLRDIYAARGLDYLNPIHRGKFKEFDKNHIEASKKFPNETWTSNARNEEELIKRDHFLENGIKEGRIDMLHYKGKDFVPLGGFTAEIPDRGTIFNQANKNPLYVIGINTNSDVKIPSTHNLQETANHEVLGHLYTATRFNGYNEFNNEYLKSKFPKSYWASEPPEVTRAIVNSKQNIMYNHNKNLPPDKKEVTLPDDVLQHKLRNSPIDSFESDNQQFIKDIQSIPEDKWKKLWLIIQPWLQWSMNKQKNNNKLYS